MEWNEGYNVRRAEECIGGVGTHVENKRIHRRGGPPVGISWRGSMNFLYPTGERSDNPGSFSLVERSRDSIPRAPRESNDMSGGSRSHNKSSVRLIRANSLCAAFRTDRGGSQS